MKVELLDSHYDGYRWVKAKFVRIEATTTLLNWLQDNYGTAKFQSTYWTDWNYVTMNDKIYVHWMLCK